MGALRGVCGEGGRGGGVPSAGLGQMPSCAGRLRRVNVQAGGRSQGGANSRAAVGCAQPVDWRRPTSPHTVSMHACTESAVSGPGSWLYTSCLSRTSTNATPCAGAGRVRSGAGRVESVWVNSRSLPSWLAHERGVWAAWIGGAERLITRWDEGEEQGHRWGQRANWTWLARIGPPLWRALTHHAF